MVNEIRKRARLILMADKADTHCSKSAENFLMFKFSEENYHDYLKKAETCWKFTNDMQTKILCDVCDPKAVKNLDYKQGYVYINKKAKSMFESSCSEMLKTNL